MKLHFKPLPLESMDGKAKIMLNRKNSSLDVRSIRQALGLVLGAYGLCGSLTYSSQEDGSLIAQFDDASDAINDEIKGLCKGALSEWGDMIFEEVKN